MFVRTFTENVILSFLCLTRHYRLGVQKDYSASEMMTNDKMCNYIQRHYNIRLLLI